MMSMKQSTSSMSFPEDLIIEILSRLPTKTLVRSKSASNSLLNLIISPEFVKLHLGHRPLVQNSSKILLYSGKTFFTSFDVEQLQRPQVQIDIHPDMIKFLEPSRYYNPKIIGISNGVVCFKKENEIFLYNPATRACRQVPRRLSRNNLITLFAYDCVSDDFKIFCILENDNWQSEIYLYKLKDNLWSKIESPPRALHHDPRGSHIANNCLYWTTHNYDSKEILLMRFDVSSHKYEEMPLPPIELTYIMVQTTMRLGVLNGRLHMIMLNANSFDIWMLKEDDCWTRVFHCSESRYRDLFRLLSRLGKKFSCLLLQYSSSKDKPKIILGLEIDLQMQIISCDLESQTTSWPNVIGLPEHNTFAATSWAESLVPLP